jgi:hypothetical protein
MTVSDQPEFHPAIRPRRIGICGSSTLPARAEIFCRALGRALAKADTPILVTGGCHYREGREDRLSADWHTIAGALEVLKSPERINSRIETLLPDSSKERQDRDKRIVKFREGRVISLPHTTPQARRFHLVSSIDVLVGVAGDTGTEQNLQLAFALDLPTLPVPFFGGKASELAILYGEQVRGWFGIDEPTWKRWLALRGEDAAAEDLELAAATIANLLIARLKMACFVIMPFGSKYEPLYHDAIQPAVDAAGFLPVRTDKLNAPGEILSTIHRGIENCDCAIAVITEWSPNVFYELGLAHGQRKPVLILLQAKAGEIETNVPFDVRTHTILRYTEIDEALVGRIREMLLEARRSFMPGRYLAFKAGSSSGAAPVA